jgi:predicted phosphodiesterase
MSLLFSGDVHGDSTYLWNVGEAARVCQASAIVLLGDIGLFWPRAGEGHMDMLRQVAKERPVYLVPGNHENYDEIEAHGSISGLEPQEWYKNVFHLPRGCRIELEGQQCLAMGGGYSVDKYDRQLGHSYWEQETVSDADIELGLAGGPVDVVLAHDAPWECAPHIAGRHARWKIEAFPESNDHMRRMGRLLDLAPKRWLHGHHHHAYTTRVGKHDTLVSGLASNWEGFPESILRVEW